MTHDPQSTRWKPGDRVLWGESDPLPGTLLGLSIDEVTPEWQDRCNDFECPALGEPTWRIRFDDGREKPRCCVGAIVRRLDA